MTKLCIDLSIRPWLLVPDLDDDALGGEEDLQVKKYIYQICVYTPFSTDANMVKGLLIPLLFDAPGQHIFRFLCTL